MPFLDMICCAFGGVVVLYLITPQVDSDFDPFAITRIVEIRTASAAPYVIGARFDAGGATAECFDVDCPRQPGAVREWTTGQGRLTAVLADNAPAPGAIEVAILRGPNFFTTDCILVRAEIEGQQRLLALTFDAGFRRRIDPFDDSSAAEESCP